MSFENETCTASFQIIAGTFCSLGKHSFNAQVFTSQHLCPFPRDVQAFSCCTDIPRAVALCSPAIPSGMALTAGQEEVQLQHSLEEKPCTLSATGAGCLILYLLCQKCTLPGAWRSCRVAFQNLLYMLSDIQMKCNYGSPLQAFIKHQTSENNTSALGNTFWLL